MSFAFVVFITISTFWIVCVAEIIYKYVTPFKPKPIDIFLPIIWALSGGVIALYFMGYTWFDVERFLINVYFTIRPYPV